MNNLVPLQLTSPLFSPTMATTTATERCLVLPELIDKIISLLERNDRISCLRINSTWRDLALPHINSDALSEVIDKILSYLDKNDQIKCLRVNTTWQKVAFRHVLGDALAPLYGYKARLLNQPLAQEALVRNSAHIQSLHTYSSDILLNLLGNAPHCTNLVSLQCGLFELTEERFGLLRQLVLKNPSLSKVYFYHVSNRVDLEELAKALQSCQRLTEFSLNCHHAVPGANGNEFASKLDPRGLASLIRGLSYPTVQLKDLALGVSIGDPPQGWTLFETDCESHSVLFPTLERLSFAVIGECGPWAEDFYLPILRESTGLRYLCIPEMPDRAVAEVTATLTRMTPPLEELSFMSPRFHPGFGDIVKACRGTLHTVRANRFGSAPCEPILQALLPVYHDATDLCLRTNLQRIFITLQASPTVSVLMQKIMTTLPNLRVFYQNWSDPVFGAQPGRLEISDMVSAPWVCFQLRLLIICLGGRTVGDNVGETQLERRDKICQVYKQLGQLTRLRHARIGCNVLGGSSEVELDFTLENGLEAMKPCLERMEVLLIDEVAGCRFGQKERDWVVQHGPQLGQGNNLRTRQLW